MKSVFITGAGGFIGSYITKEFIDANWKVYALIYNNLPDELLSYQKENKLIIVKGDIRNLEVIAKQLNGECFDAVVHCAAKASDIGKQKDFREINFDAVKSLITDLNFNRFIFISTTDVYGMKDFCGETEDELALCNNTGNYYPEFKIQSEKYIKNNLPKEKYVIIRPAAVWGLGDKHFIPRTRDFLASCPYFIYFGKWRGKNRWPLAHVRNVSKAVCLSAIDDEVLGLAINILDSEYTTTEDFYKMIADRYFPSKVFKNITIPMFAGKLIGYIVSFLCDLFDKAITDPTFYAVYTLSSNLDFSNKRFLELLKRHNISPFTKEEELF